MHPLNSNCTPFKFKGVQLFVVNTYGLILYPNNSHLPKNPIPFLGYGIF